MSRAGAFSSEKKLPRLGLESQRGTRHMVAPGDRRELRENRLVAPVHAVEITDGERATTMVPAQSCEDRVPAPMFLGSLPVRADAAAEVRR